MLGGVDCGSISATLREKIGICSTKRRFVLGDIASNILFGNPNGGENL